MHSQASFDIFSQALQNQQGPGILYGGQMILLPASHIASMLWPTRARSRKRGESLRKVLQLGDKHALNDRRLSEIWERIDEKTDEWIAATKGEQVVFDFVGDPASLGEQAPKDECVYRGYNPATHIYTFRGVSYNLPAVAKAINDVAARVDGIFRQLFPEQAKAEDEQRRQAIEAQRAAQEAATAETAPAPATEAKPAKKAPAKKPAAKKAAPKKPAAKKPAAKKAPAKKPAAKKAAPKKAAAK
ncbi:MAG: hypothetical protein AB3N28_00560 [Kordiimonas sp.]